VLQCVAVLERGAIEEKDVEQRERGALQRVAACCSVLQRVAVLQRGADKELRVEVGTFKTKLGGARTWWSARGVSCSVVQCIAGCCILLQCVTKWCSVSTELDGTKDIVEHKRSVLQCVAVCCGVWQCDDRAGREQGHSTVREA